MTGTAVVEHAEIEPGDRVLMMAAAGGIGTLLVQLAHSLGARVVGAARGAEKLALVRRLGADAAIDYTEDDWTSSVRDGFGGQDVDVLPDGAGGALGAEAFPLVADCGRVSAHGAASGGFATIDERDARGRGIVLRGIADVQFTAPEMVRLAEQALARVRPVIAREYPLSAAADAHRAIEAREIVGKALLIP